MVAALASTVDAALGLFLGLTSNCLFGLVDDGHGVGVELLVLLQGTVHVALELDVEPTISEGHVVVLSDTYDVGLDDDLEFDMHSAVSISVAMITRNALPLKKGHITHMYDAPLDCQSLWTSLDAAESDAQPARATDHDEHCPWAACTPTAESRSTALRCDPQPHDERDELARRLGCRRGSWLS